MYRALTDEQAFLLDAARDALGRVEVLETTRAALDGGPPAELWPVAVDAGWTGLLVGEDADGAGLAPAEAVLVLEACGARLADARLLGHLPATWLLDAAGDPTGVLPALAAGDRRAALVAAPLGERSRPPRITAGNADGEVRTIVDAPGADVLVVVGVDEDGKPAAAVVEGVEVAARAAYDATRLVGDVVLDDAAGTALEVDPAALAHAVAVQRLLLAAESVGVADACLAMSRAYALDRVAFGRPIGSYQAIKHKLVEMLRRIEGARSLTIAAGRVWAEDPARFDVLAAAAQVAAADALGFAAPESIFVHGGVGATWEHDLSLHYRRAEHARRLAGGVGAAAEAVAAGLLDEAVPVPAEPVAAAAS